MAWLKLVLCVGDPSEVFVSAIVLILIANLADMRPGPTQSTLHGMKNAIGKNRIIF